MRPRPAVRPNGAVLRLVAFLVVAFVEFAVDVGRARVAEDLVRAHMWLSIVAERGYSDAVKMRETVVNGMVVGSNLS